MDKRYEANMVDWDSLHSGFRVPMSGSIFNSNLFSLGITSIEKHEDFISGDAMTTHNVVSKVDAATKYKSLKEIRDTINLDYTWVSDGVHKTAITKATDLRAYPTLTLSKIDFEISYVPSGMGEVEFKVILEVNFESPYPVLVKVSLTSTSESREIDKVVCYPQDGSTQLIGYFKSNLYFEDDYTDVDIVLFNTEYPMHNSQTLTRRIYSSGLFAAFESFAQCEYGGPRATYIEDFQLHIPENQVLVFYDVESENSKFTHSSSVINYTNENSTRKKFSIQFDLMSNFNRLAKEIVIGAYFVFRDTITSEHITIHGSFKLLQNAINSSSPVMPQVAVRAYSGGAKICAFNLLEATDGLILYRYRKRFSSDGVSWGAWSGSLDVGADEGGYYEASESLMIIGTDLPVGYVNVEMLVCVPLDRVTDMPINVIALSGQEYPASTFIRATLANSGTGAQLIKTSLVRTGDGRTLTFGVTGISNGEKVIVYSYNDDEVHTVVKYFSEVVLGKVEIYTHGAVIGTYTHLRIFKHSMDGKELVYSGAERFPDIEEVPTVGINWQRINPTKCIVNITWTLPNGAQKIILNDPWTGVYTFDSSDTSPLSWFCTHSDVEEYTSNWTARAYYDELIGAQASGSYSYKV